MKLGKDFPEKWKEKSIRDEISLSDLLYGFAVENLMQRIEKSSFKEYLWLTNEDALGESAYKKKSKASLEFIYVESGKKSFQEKLAAGQAFSPELMDFLMAELFSESDGEESWEYNVKKLEGGMQVQMTCKTLGMKVPVSMRILKANLNGQRPKEKEQELLLEERKRFIYFSYPKEAILAEALFEMMRKLELISNMEAYDIANEIIKTQSISGRHILEDFKAMGEKEPKVVSLKRLEQIASYKNYGYMKKKWQQYARNHKTSSEDWEEMMDRILSFLEPLWKALCQNEIFFDDWMPELGRFLG